MADGAGLKEEGKLKIRSPGLADAGEQTDTDERMAAESEEVVIEADLRDAEQLLPPGCECGLDVFAARGLLGKRCGGCAAECGGKCGLFNLIESLRNGNYRKGRARLKDAHEGADAFLGRDGGAGGDFDETFAAAGRSVVCAAIEKKRAGEVAGDAAHGEALDLGDDAALGIEEGDVEGDDLAVRGVLAARLEGAVASSGTDEAEEASRKGSP